MKQPFSNLPVARRDLLRVLLSPSNVRADVIRQLHERGDEDMVKVLTELEADAMLRLQVVEDLRAGVCLSQLYADTGTGG